jgi:hypothetical protein
LCYDYIRTDFQITKTSWMMGAVGGYFLGRQNESRFLSCLAKGCTLLFQFVYKDTQTCPCLNLCVHHVPRDRSDPTLHTKPCLPGIFSVSNCFTMERCVVTQTQAYNQTAGDRATVWHPHTWQGKSRCLALSHTPEYCWRLWLHSLSALEIYRLC